MAESRAAQEEALRLLRAQQAASLAKMKLPTTTNWAAGTEDGAKRNRQESGELTLAEIQVYIVYIIYNIQDLEI